MAFPNGAFVITLTEGRRVGQNVTPDQLRDIARVLGVADLNPPDIKNIYCVGPKERKD